MPRPQQRLDYLILSVLILLAFVGGCNPGPASRPSSSLGTPMPVSIEVQALPTYTPTPLPLGSPDNPVRIGFVGAAQSEEQRQSLEWISATISSLSSYHVTVVPYSQYILMERDLLDRKLEMAWVQPVEYLLASEKGLLSALLVSNHLGVTAYGVQFVGNAASNFALYFDAGTNRSVEPAEVALAQLSGLRPCLSSETSLSGYWVPVGYLKRANISFQDPVLTYSHAASLRALYIRGVCDYAVTYAISADPRTSSEVLIDLPDALNRLPILWISPAVIPNMVLSSSPGLDSVIQNRITEALINMAQSEDGRNQLSVGLAYETAGLEPFSDLGFQELRDLLNNVDLNLSSLLPQP